MIRFEAMVIDLILDRRDGVEYDPRDFYYEVSKYGDVFPEIVFPITAALDGGGEADVRRELCSYVDEMGYDPGIKDYINSVEWL